MTPKPAPKDETVRTSVILPRSLHERLGHAAVEDRVPATEIARVAIGEWLDRRDRKPRKGGAR